MQHSIVSAMKYTVLVLLLMASFSQAAENSDNPMLTEQCKRSSHIKEIRFLKESLPLLKSGKKRVTIRRGIRCVRPGTKIIAKTAEGKVLGALMVTKASVIFLNQIGAELAKLENTTIEGLKQRLVSQYGPEVKRQRLTVVYFGWLPSFGF